MFLLLVSAGNIALARSASKGLFTFGLVLTGLGAGFASVVESMLAIRGGGGGEKGTPTKTDLLLANQLVEAAGRLTLVKAVSWLFSLRVGREGQLKGELAFYGVAGMALLAVGAVAGAAHLGETDTRAVSTANSVPEGIQDEARGKTLADRGVVIDESTPLLGGGRRGQREGHERLEI